MTDSEIALMRRLVSRDQSALSELYHQYGRLVYSLAVKILQNADSAEEVTQDVFLRVWNNAMQWNSERGRLSTWLLIITRSVAIDRLRRDKHTTATTLAEEAITASTNGLSWLDKSQLYTLLQKLPDDQRILIEQAFLAGFTHSELAEHFDLPLGTVKSRIRAGLARLKDLWKLSGDDILSDDNP